MNSVQWIGVGILVFVTAILVVETVAWLMPRIRRHRKSVEFRRQPSAPASTRMPSTPPEPAPNSRPKSEALPSNRLKHLEDVRRATVLSYSADRRHRVRWLTFSVARPLQHSLRRSRTLICPYNGDQR